MDRNAENRWEAPPAAAARSYTKLGEYFEKMGNGDLEVLAFPIRLRYCFRCIEGVNFKTNSRAGKINDIDSDVANMEDTFTSILTKAARMFTSKEISENKKILHALNEIGELRIYAECIIETAEKSHN